MESDILNYFSSDNFWLSLIIAAAAIMLLFIMGRAEKTFRKQRKTINNSNKINALSKIIFSIAKVLIIFFAVIFILEVNNINVSSLIAGLGLTGIIVGFAVQDLLKDLIMGVYIATDSFFSVGDVVEYGKGRLCVVKAMSLKSTKLFDADTGDELTVSNRNITEIRKVSNWLDIIVPAPYEEPALRMREVCTRIAEKSKEIEHVTDTKFLGTSEFADSLIQYKIRVFCVPVEKGQVRREVLGIIQDVYAEEGIAIPFNQLDVHVQDLTKTNS